MTQVTVAPEGSDMFSSLAGHNIVINAVHSVPMPSPGGLAAIFARKFPLMWQHFTIACRMQVPRADLPWIWVEQNYGPNYEPLTIVNMVTMDDRPGKYGASIENIKMGLDFLFWWAITAEKSGFVINMGIPALGCGIGGLKWEDVSPLITEHRYLPYIIDAKTAIVLYPPLKTPKLPPLQIWRNVNDTSV